MPRYPKGIDVHTLPGPYHSGRATKSQLEFTASKLLLGAGPGIDPTEIGIGTGVDEVATGDHTHTITITEVAKGSVLTTSNVWQTVATGTVPASAKKVSLWGAAGSTYGYPAGAVRGNYNGVERFIVSAVWNGAGSWLGDGIGADANADIQVRSTNGVNDTTGGGGIHYVSI